MATSTFTKTGNKAATPAKLDKAVFEVPVKNHDLLKQAYVAYLANGRRSLAKAKSRGEVSGGGKKPWRQKGTGRARFGSSRNPVWRGGGAAFGPTGEENYTHRLSTRQKHQALRQALTLAAHGGKLIVIEEFVIKETKTAAAAALINRIGAERQILIVTDTVSTDLERSLRNLPGCKLTAASYLTVYDILNASSIVVTGGALDAISAWLGGKTRATAGGQL